MFIISCVPSVSRDQGVSLWLNVFIYSGLLRRLLFETWRPEPIHVRHRLNILNGSVVVQLLDSWTNTSSSIKLVTDTLLQDCALLPQSQKKKKHTRCCEDVHLQQKPPQTRREKHPKNTKHTSSNDHLSCSTHLWETKKKKGACNEFPVHDSDSERSIYDSGIRSR